MPATRMHVLAWSALSGVLWALAWPGIGGVAPLAFIAWLPLLHAQRLHDRIIRDRPRSFVPYAMLAVFIWNASTSWWFFLVSEPWSTRLISGLAPMTVNTLLMTVPWWLQRMARKQLGPRMAYIAFAAFWLAFEHIHHAWDLQWPWFTMGNVFAEHPAWIQWYSITGALGGSLWVLLVSGMLDVALRNLQPGQRPWMKRSLAAALVVLFVPWGLSAWMFRSYGPDRGKAVEVVVVQPNVDPYTEKFGGVDPMEQLDRMLEQAEGAITDHTVLVVLPETALQERAALDFMDGSPVLIGLWENDLAASQSVRRIRRFQQLHPKVAVIAGMSSAYLLPNTGERPISARPIIGTDLWYEAYNAAVFLPSYGPVEHYHKSKLVAGVELMPFERFLGPLSALSVDLGGTTGSLGQQEERSVLRDSTSGIAIVPAICYESVFGEHVAAHVVNGGDLIVIMTNDGWWGDSPGPVQHLSFASLRAIETRRSIARSANTGISCFVDQRGVVRDRTPWWRPAVIRSVVALNTELTFFVRHGDLIGRGASISAALFLLLGLVLRYRQRP
jgi:apolipoprotein N-acyltransferase